MTGYFIAAFNKVTFVKVHSADVADEGAARDIVKKWEREGLSVSLWKATRIYVTRE